MANEVTDAVSAENAEDKTQTGASPVLTGVSPVSTEVNPAELSDEQAAPQNEETTDGSEKQELLDKLAALEAELLKEQIKVRLLVLGILPEKLEDGAAMAYGLCLAGKTPDNAANEIINAYPHFKAMRQEMPQFSSECAGSGDGFSAIRKIFSSR